MSNQNSGIFCKGRVKFYDARKNKFGFITIKNSSKESVTEDVFFKENSLRNPNITPADGVLLYCYVQKGNKGYIANEVIRIGELTKSERQLYIDLLYPKDTLMLIIDILEKEVSISKKEADTILNTAMDYYSGIDPYVWKFIFEYGDDKQKAVLHSYYTGLNFSQKLEMGSVVDELLTKVVSNYYDYSSSEILELVNHLFEDEQSKYISDELWIEYLKLQSSVKETIFFSLKSGFKKELTLEHFSWSAKDVLILIEKFKADEVELDEDLLWALFQKNYANFSFIYNTSNYSNWNQVPTFKSFLKNVLNQRLSNNFITEFIDINVDFISKEPLNKALRLVLQVDEARQEAQSKNLLKFYSGILNQFKSDFTDKFSDFDQSAIFENIESLKALGLFDIVIQNLSRSSVIELHFKDDAIEIDFKEDYKYLGQLDFDIQRKFIFDLSKTAKKDNGKLFWSVLDKLKNDLFENSNKSYDPSTVFIFYLLSQLENADSLDNTALDASEVFEFVFTKLTDELFIEQKLHGYFEHCEGKAFAMKLTPEDWEMKRTNNNPCKYCEGKLMKNSNTGAPLVDELTNKEKYWCRNSICLSPSRQEQNHGYYFTGILNNIGFTNTDNFIGFVNGCVNKINTYLDHLQCRNCEKALKPKKVGSGYYRVSHFYCSNPECDEYGEDNSVYLTHCINSKCEEYIDSRDSAQCEHNWYICVHCLGCCSTEKIQDRIEYYAQTNQLYDGPTKGHQELGKLFCPDCGELINSNNNNGIYEDMLNKFKHMKTNHPNVIRWGQRSNDNKYWFLLKKSSDNTFDDFDSKIKKLSEIGFNVADDYIHGNEVALISEKFTDLDIICPSCNYSINIRELYKEGDYYRAQAIEKWHNEIFS